MLKLLVFAPCQKVIVGEDDHLTSMIALMESVTVQVRGELPADAIVPLPWSVLTLWRREEDLPTPKIYEQRLEVFRPDGERAAHALSTFNVSNVHNNFRNVIVMNAFPAGKSGWCSLKLFLREAGDQNQWTECSDYPLEIIHENLPEDANKTAQS